MEQAVLKAQIMDALAMDRAITRIAHEIIEHNEGANGIALVAIQRRGVPIAERLAAKIEATPIKVTVKVSESGKIYGSVTNAQVEEALKAVGIEVDKKNITIPDDIKVLGEYEGAVKVYKAVKAALKFVVEAEA